MKKKILVVEDDKSLLQLETILLNTRGYVVRAVSDGEAALDFLSEEKPDLVLLDILLPLMDGFEVCQRINRNPSIQNIPVVFLSAKKARMIWHMVSRWVQTVSFVNHSGRTNSLRSKIWF